ncbi:2Fe-2S iron-sulfur cluster-binding protein [uncultured Corynebacterium sp.]|mgnify:CR=1 FL=1|uniref:2Fe-2S iron-sulfur cluster-binding protein n=1 Tax=uncultured Corynebacterium sp. TaxID=159447 RepID=UPI0025F3749A|nr:2Fe-2S iron-sulfur cluster-binding protein [uncultured Corynebacterium sp.]
MTRTFTTPLTPSDYASLFDPLRGREIRGRIESITHHGDLINLTLTPGPGLPTTFRSGQFIGLGVLIDGRWQWRCFSITDAPRPHLTSLSLGIKPVPDGAVSTHVATNAKPGDIIRLTSPGGDFYLPQPVPDKLLFVTAGSGITPVMSMLRWLRQEYGAALSQPHSDNVSSANAFNSDANAPSSPTTSHANNPANNPATRPAVSPAKSPVPRPVTFPDVIHIHSQRSTEVPSPYGAELRQLSTQNPSYRLIHWNSEVRGRLNPHSIAGLVPDLDERERFACGPTQLLDAMTDAFPGTHVEHFHVATEGAATGGRIRFLASAGNTSRGSADSGRGFPASTNHATPTHPAAESCSNPDRGFPATTTCGAHTETDCDGSTTILEAAEACGVQLTHGCRMGICHTCTSTIKEGQAVDIRTGTTHREGERVRTCSAIPDGDIAIEQT